jgi:aspartyl-tRNA(Asn)/glutamyl-tRNA(Gln) amidotransferase subunit A
MCRYMFLGNLTGLPAGTVPVGIDPEGLPIGFQLVGDAWDEATVLALMGELERTGAARSPRSPHHLSLLE